MRGLKALQSVEVEAAVAAFGHLAFLLFGRRFLFVADRVPPSPSPSSSSSSSSSSTLTDDSLRLSATSSSLESMRAAGILFHRFESPICHVSFHSDASSGLRLAVATRNATVHWWSWNSSKTQWISETSVALSQPLVELKAELLAACVDPTSRGGPVAWLCMEHAGTYNELVLNRRHTHGVPLVLARVPGDVETARLWATLDGHVWIHSSYGGLVFVNVAERYASSPPVFFKGILRQHPQTRELVLLEPTESDRNLDEERVWTVWILQVQSQRIRRQKICCINSHEVIDVAFLHQCICLLDQGGSRCTLFDLGTGIKLRSFSTPLGQRFAEAGSEGHIPVFLWSPSGAVDTVLHESIAALEARLPIERGVGLADEWGLSRLAAWRLLSEGSDPKSLARLTAIPALSVAQAGGQPTAALVEMTNEYLRDQDPRHQFQRFSELTPSVNPLLNQWVKAELEPLNYLGDGGVDGERDNGDSDEELWELRASDSPELVLDELLALSKSAETMRAWQYSLACRLLFKFRPEKLAEFVDQVRVAGDPSRQERARVAVCGTPLANARIFSQAQADAMAAILVAAGNSAAAARTLIAAGIPQTIEFHLAFAEAVRLRDEDTLLTLWGSCDLNMAALIRMLHVYGAEAEVDAAGRDLTMALVKKLIQRKPLLL